MADIANTKIGACDVTFATVDLGHTLGGVTFSYEPNLAEIKVDAYGDTPVDYMVNGELVTVKVNLAEMSVAALKAAIPNHTLEGSIVHFGAGAGTRLSAKAGVLVLHPRAATGTTEDITLHKAVVYETVEIPYNNEDQRVFEVTFVALPDESKDAGKRLGAFGDLTP